MNSCYYQLNSWKVLAFFFSKGKASYFRVTGAGQKLIKNLGLKGRLRPLAFHFYELTEDDGGSSFPLVYRQDLLSVVNEADKAIAQNEFVRRFGKLFGQPGKIKLFFKKSVNNLLTHQVLVLKALERAAKRDDGQSIEYHVPWSPFIPSLAAHAAANYGIKVISRYSLADFLQETAKLVFIGALFVRGWLSAFFKPGPSLPAGKKNMLGNLYTLKGFTFEPDKRCDFPWLLQFSGEAAILYFEREDRPVTEEMVKELRRRRINAAALSPKATGGEAVQVYRFSLKFVVKSVGLLVKTLYYFGCYGGGLRSLTYLAWAVRFIFEFARHYDFYSQLGIKVNVDFVDFDPYRIARHLAIAASGGIGVSYQNSNWPIPNPSLASGADLLFLFGHYYLALQQAVGSRCGRYLYAGYPTDYSFPAARAKGGELRKKLSDNGAQFIVCYFDENSADDSLSLIPNSRSAEVYGELLRAVLADQSLGLICSPKRPSTLLMRLPEIAGLIDQAKATGRCVFMDGEYGTETFPAQASLAADITITILLGGTTALECFLAGSRVVYLDLEKLYSYEEYQWGKGTLVFDDLDALLAAVNEVRQNPASRIGRRGLVPNLAEKDPFQDGQAAKRMASYLNSLLEKFNLGADRQAALAYADEQFAKAWGSDKIVKGSQ
ncbi:MAG: hypothetical protein ABIH56_07905 [Candidatus Margulisiibacteriota bacterium]